MSGPDDERPDARTNPDGATNDEEIADSRRSLAPEVSLQAALERLTSLPPSTLGLGSSFPSTIAGALRDLPPLDRLQGLGMASAELSRRLASVTEAQKRSLGMPLGFDSHLGQVTTGYGDALMSLDASTSALHAQLSFLADNAPSSPLLGQLRSLSTRLDALTSHPLFDSSRLDDLTGFAGVSGLALRVDSARAAARTQALNDALEKPESAWRTVPLAGWLKFMREYRGLILSLLLFASGQMLDEQRAHEAAVLAHEHHETTEVLFDIVTDLVVSVEEALPAMDDFDRLIARRSAPVRAAPSAKASEVARIIPEESVTWITQEGTWILVGLDDRETDSADVAYGWVHKRHLTEP